jgi:hypothetical protein
MSKVLVVRYDAEELYHVPDWIDLEDTTQVKTYYVKWSILHVFLTDGRHIVIKPMNDEIEFDTKYGDCCDINDSDDYFLEYEEPEWKEVDDSAIADADAGFIKSISEKVICTIIDKIKAEAEAKAEATNLTRTVN